MQQEWGPNYRLKCAMEDLEKVVRWSNEGSECKRGYLLPAATALGVYDPDNAWFLFRSVCEGFRRDTTELQDSRCLALVHLVQGLSKTRRDQPKQWFSAQSLDMCRSLALKKYRLQVVTEMVYCFFRDTMTVLRKEDDFATLPLEEASTFVSQTGLVGPGVVFLKVAKKMMENREKPFLLTDLVQFYSMLEKQDRSGYPNFQEFLHHYFEAFALHEGQKRFRAEDLFRLVSEKLPADERRDAFLAKLLGVLQSTQQQKKKNWVRPLASSLMKLYSQG